MSVYDLLLRRRIISRALCCGFLSLRVQVIVIAFEVKFQEDEWRRGSLFSEVISQRMCCP